MAIATWHWAVMSIVTLLTCAFLYVVKSKGDRMRKTDHNTQLKHQASQMQIFKDSIRKKNGDEPKVDVGIAESPKKKKKRSTPKGAEDEEYVAGYYKILHKTRSRQGLQMTSEPVDVLRVGETVYIEVFSRYENRIRGRLGKKHEGWLTVKDVDRQKVFIQKTKPPREEVESSKVSTTPNSTQENRYGIGWYKILHKTRSREGQTLESDIIDVLHPGEVIYVESTALYKNRIRGKLGKNRSGWLTMEDVDRKKVFVQTTKKPNAGSMFGGVGKPANEKKDEEVIWEKSVPKLQIERQEKLTLKGSREENYISDNGSKNLESESRQSREVHVTPNSDPTPRERKEKADIIMEIEIPEVPRTKKKRKPRTKVTLYESEDERYWQRQRREPRRGNRKGAKRRHPDKGRYVYDDYGDQGYGGDHITKDRELLEEEVYRALRQRRKNREKKRRQEHEDNGRNEDEFDVMADVLIDGGVIDEILDDYEGRSRRKRGPRFRNHSRAEGETRNRRRLRQEANNYGPHADYYSGHHGDSLHPHHYAPNYFYPQPYFGDEMDIGGNRFYF